MKRIFAFYVFLLLWITGCGLDREIEVDIPDFEPGYVVECYIGPGEPFGLLLTRSRHYFDYPDGGEIQSDQLSSLLVQGADGTVIINEEEFQLKNQVRVNPSTQKIYNYVLPRKINFQAGDQLRLNLHLPTGENISARTHVPCPMPIDSIVLKSNEAGEIKSTCYMTTKEDTVQYVHRKLFRMREGKTAIVQDIIADNTLSIDGILSFGSGYDFLPGDTLISRLTHLTKEYYDFYKSASGSVSANTIPFTQPGQIVSNVEGSDRVIGVFAGYHPGQQLVILE